MQNYGQRRQVTVDEDVLRQLISQAQTTNQQQMLVPRQAANPNEYRILSEDYIRNDELNRYIDEDAREIDLNRRRNEILQETWGSTTLM